jgi:hypothetical protein
MLRVEITLMFINILLGVATLLGLVIVLHYRYIAVNKVRAMGEIRVGEMGRAAQMGDKERIEQWMSQRIDEIRARARRLAIIAALLSIVTCVTLVLRIL